MLRPNEYFSLPQHASMNFSRLLVVELAGLLELLLLQRKSVHQKVYLDPDPIEAEIMEHVRGEHKKVLRFRFQPIMIGQTLDHYCILEQIGAGGMRVVYRARDEVTLSERSYLSSVMKKPAFYSDGQGKGHPSPATLSQKPYPRPFTQKI